ncbi:granzyme B-like [Xyrauchen texanus]|uniref:granzyme B-like n=1 Tax=Xyrauchen texanus TaxID=154827 RepID=UPI002242ABA4|nr:granzyme B-like [Xyrauchen texanus]
MDISIEEDISILENTTDIEAGIACSVAGWGLLKTKGKLAHGDSGGPLVCWKTAVGITSFGSAKLCNDPTLPNVSTKISANIPWICLIVEKTE